MSIEATPQRDVAEVKEEQAPDEDSPERVAERRAAVERILPTLRSAVGDEHVYVEDHQLRTYESDGLLHYRSKPAAVVLPDTAEQVRDVIRTCYEAEVPWVPRGAGSGLSGGALPVAGGVVVALSRLRKVLDVDLPNGRVVVEPGVTNVEVSAAVAPGHFYPPDPSSQIVCTIGGNVAENSGGAHCFKYGFTTNYVLGLEVVLSDGTLLELGGPQADLPGLDLIGAMVGAEGTLAVVTKITLRVIPSPESVRTLAAFFPTVAEAGNTVSEIVTGGVIPAAIEMMDSLAIEAAEAATQVGFPTDAGAALVIELDGSEQEVESQFGDLSSTCEGCGATEVRIAEDAAQAALFWKARKACFAAMGRISNSYYVQDGVIPRTKLSEVLGVIEELSASYELRVANVFHAGDGNLHPLVCFSGEEEAEKAEELSGKILEACVEAGGSITGEHGIGVDKKAYMPKMFGEPDLAAFQKLRCAFDPHGLANPGKVMPSPRLCGEVPGLYRQHPLEQAGVAERF